MSMRQSVWSRDYKLGPLKIRLESLDNGDKELDMWFNPVTGFNVSYYKGTNNKFKISKPFEHENSEYEWKELQARWKCFWLVVCYPL